MRIGIVWHCRYPWDVRIEKFAGSIRKAGHGVVLLTKGAPGLPGREEDGGIVTLRVPARPLPGPALRCAAAPLFFNPFWSRGIWQAVRREHLDMLVVRDLPMALAVAAVGKMLGVPVVLDMAENYPAALLTYGKTLYAPFLFAHAWLPRRYERLVLALIDAVIVVAEEQRQRLVRAGIDPGRISIVGNTPDPRALAAFGSAVRDPGVPGRYVLYSGFMDRHRGVRTLVLAFDELRDRYADLKLVLIGAGNESRDLERIVRERGLEGRVILKGWLDFREIPAYIRHSALCVIPHLKTEHTDTTIPNKLFDYLYFGKPVIVSDAAPLKRIMDGLDPRRVFPSGDHRALAAVMASVLDAGTSPAERSRGRELVERVYNWDRDGENLVRLLETTGRK